MNRLRQAWDEVLILATCFGVGMAVAILFIPILIWLGVEDIRFKSKLKKQDKMKKMKEAVLKTAKGLCHPNNTVTTLEVKNQLIKDYPQYHWRQNVGDNSVSNLMDALATDGKFTYTDNGTFRTYSDPTYVFPTTKATKVTKVAAVKVKKTYAKKNKGIPVVKVSTGKKRGPYMTKAKKAALATPVSAPVATTTRITKPKSATHNVRTVSRTAALKMIQKHKGKCRFATFVKKEGDTRTMRFELVQKDPDSLGYLHVNDVHLVKKGDANPLRMINLQTLKSIKLSGKKYNVR